MPKASKPGYYAVRKGREPGIYSSWDECQAQTKGFAGAMYKKLASKAEAKAFMTGNSSASAASTSKTVNAPRVASTSTARVSDSEVVAKAIEVVRAVNEDEKDCDIVYCDGACKGNGQAGSVAGVGVWWGHGDPRNIAERCPGDQTNNRAELIAIVRILETTPPLTRKLLIKTDSKYSIQCVSSWIFKWMGNGFLASDGKPVKNRALIKYLAALLHARRTTSQKVEFKHVRGHVGIEGNEAADQLANLGVTKPLVPERDWERLEEELLRSLKLVKFKPAKKVDDDLKEYADCLLDDDAFATLSDTSIGVIKPPQQVLKPALNSGESSKLPPLVSSALTTKSMPKLPPPKAVPSIAPPLPAQSNKRTGSESKFKQPSNGASSSVAKPASKLPSPKRPPSKLGPTIAPTAAQSKEELEAYASCLLDSDELTNFGKDGTFDSDC